MCVESGKRSYESVGESYKKGVNGEFMFDFPGKFCWLVASRHYIGGNKILKWELYLRIPSAKIAEPFRKTLKILKVYEGKKMNAYWRPDLILGKTPKLILIPKASRLELHKERNKIRIKKMNFSFFWDIKLDMIYSWPREVQRWTKMNNHRRKVW